MVVVDLEHVEFVEVEVSEGHVAKAVQTVVSSQLGDQLAHGARRLFGLIKNDCATSSMPYLVRV